jgi:N-acetylmuramoyl-L-alanine amidase CwlA
MSYIINNSIRAKYDSGIRNVNTINSISIHYTANKGHTATARGNANYFHNLPNTAGKASAHYVVDDEEIIYQCVPDNYIANAIGGSKYNDCAKTGGGTLHGVVTNRNNISIEMVSHSNANGYYIPEETENRTIELVRDLLKRYPNIKTVCRHFDVTGKYCSPTHCLTPEGEGRWKKFLDKVYKEDEEPMTAEEKKEFEVLKEKVNSLEKVYHYTVDIPEWGRPTIQKLLDKGYYNGASASDLNLPETMLRIFVVNDRAGLYD